MNQEELWNYVQGNKYQDAIVMAYNLALDHAAENAKTEPGRGDPMGPFGISDTINKNSILNLKIKD